ncbi:MAG: protein kinase [Candidatus Obscuribacter sp.]|jgi:serine/threonine protein kinase|nr:protein kinase [Candidatus Obscuribacter sp.]MBK9202697.1 protein kinase [Candidatus Obscuribacter sp.]MBK9621201.1 protein kinase [Candidatus Obscuribacter sp.]MBK9773506.1 protein kinase [Candidatus Obscuribacter sp.]MBL0185296.1 protein kinase [Candidatus Obscuribacter sp.]
MPDLSSDNQSQTPAKPLNPEQEAQVDATDAASNAPEDSDIDSATKSSPDKTDWRMPVKTPKKYKQGDIVDKVFKLGKPLGSGGMGVVFACEHIEIKQQYAMKILADASVSQENWKRFQLEAKALARLHHPSIVGIHNMGVDQGEYPYYVMDLIDGETLETMLKRNGRLPVNEALQLFVQLASALDQAHTVGIIHRDLKPANVILVKDLRNNSTTAKLVDFGIARLSPKSGSTYSDQHQTASGLIFGTPIYMSPEQSTGKHVDQRSDIYSLGCSLVEALTAFPPFKGDSAFATILKHQTLTPPTLASLAPNGHFNESLESLIQKMLAKNPADRYQSMSQVGVDLTRILKGKSILSSGLSTTANNPLPASSQEDLDAGQDQNGKSNTTHQDSTTKSSLTIPLHYTPPQIVTKAPEEQKEDLLKNILIAAGVCIFLVLAGLAVISFIDYTGHKQQQQLTTSLDPAGDEESEFQVVAKLLKNNDYICKVGKDIQGKEVRIFTFPDNHYLGYMQLNDGEPFQAMGVIDAALDKKVSLHLQGVCTPFPIICKKLGNDNVNDLEIITEHPAEVISYLKDWTALKHFSFFNSLIHKEGFDESILTNEDVLKLDQLKGLKSLGLCDAKVTGEAILRLQLLKELDCLKLKNVSHQRVLLEALPQYPNIKELWLISASTTDRDIEILSNNPNIERLKLYHCALTPGCLPYLNKMHNLKSISLSCKWPDKLKEAAIQSLPSCEFIDYGKSSIY